MKKIGAWSIYSLAVCMSACGRTPLGNPFGGGDDSSTTPSLTPTPTSSVSGTPTPVDPCDPTHVSGADTGLLTSDIPLNHIALKPGMFLIHVSDGFFAMSSVCTHASIDMQTNGSIFNVSNVTTGFECNHQHSKFNFEGDVTQGPAVLPLKHYRLTIDANDHIFVDQTFPFPDTTCRAP